MEHGEALIAECGDDGVRNAFCTNADTTVEVARQRCAQF